MKAFKEKKYWYSILMRMFDLFNILNIFRLLEKHLDKLVDGRQNIKVFFPLCGKTLDMKW